MKIKEYVTYVIMELDLRQKSTTKSSRDFFAICWRFSHKCQDIGWSEATCVMRPTQQQMVLLVKWLTANRVTEKVLYIAPWCLEMATTLHKMERFYVLD